MSILFFSKSMLLVAAAEWVGVFISGREYYESLLVDEAGGQASPCDTIHVKGWQSCRMKNKRSWDASLILVRISHHFYLLLMLQTQFIVQNHGWSETAESVRPGTLPFCYTLAYLWLITPSAFNIWIDLSFLDTTGKLPVMLPLGSNHFHHQALFSYSENFQRCSNSGSILIFSSLAQRWHFLNWPEMKKFQLFSSDIHGQKKKKRKKERKKKPCLLKENVLYIHSFKKADFQVQLL